MADAEAICEIATRPLLLALLASGPGVGQRRGADLGRPGRLGNVKPVKNRKRMPTFSAFLYKERNLVERSFNKLKHFRGVATRSDKLGENYLAGVKHASARIWMRTYESVA